MDLALGIERSPGYLRHVAAHLYECGLALHSLFCSHLGYFGMMAAAPNAVDEYGKRIRQLPQECQKFGKRCVFMTQPALWHADLSHDDAHFTNEGARVVAEKVYEYLNSAPVRKQSSGTPSIVTFAR